MITWDDVEAAKAVYQTLALLDTFDNPCDHADYVRLKKAHIHFLRVRAAYTGASAEGIVTYLYGKQPLPVVSCVCEACRQTADIAPLSADAYEAYSDMAGWDLVGEYCGACCGKWQAAYERECAR